jgi:predicted nucleotidyltransferase
VAEGLPFTDKECAFLAALTNSGVEFMIVGLSAALLQGAPAVTQDIDLWFRDLQDPGIRKALQAVGGSYLPSIGLHPPILAGSAVALFDVVLHMDGLESFDKELKHAIEVPVGGVAVKVLAIERIITSKESANRDKDRLVLPVLRDAAAAIREEKLRRGTPGKRRRK